MCKQNYWCKIVIFENIKVILTSSSSSCHAISTDIPDHFWPPLQIVHRFRQVFRATSCIYTKLLYVGSSWSPCLCSFMWRGSHGFKLTKERSRRYPTKIITGVNNAANAPAQAETLLHSLELAAAGIGLHVNAHKTEYIFFNQTGDISTLSSSSLNLVDKFTFPGSSVSSTETDIDPWLAKAWTTIISQNWPIKAAVVSMLLYGCTTWTLTKRIEEKLDENATPHKAAAVRSPTTHHENTQNQTNQTCGTLLEK